jgi:hypothetical protein
MREDGRRILLGLETSRSALAAGRFAVPTRDHV